MQAARPSSENEDMGLVVKWIVDGRVEMLQRATAGGRVLAGRQFQGMPLLHHAAGSGFCDTMEWLVDVAQCDLHGADQRGGTALLEAAAAGHLEALVWLLRRGLRADATDERGDHLLSLAAGYGHLEVRSNVGKGEGVCLYVRRESFLDDDVYGDGRWCVGGVWWRRGAPQLRGSASLTGLALACRKSRGCKGALRCVLCRVRFRLGGSTVPYARVFVWSGHPHGI